MMKLHCITDHEYNELVYKLVFRNRQFNSTLSLSTAGFPAIGYGFNLHDDKVLYPVLESLGFDVNAKHLKGAALEAEQYYMNAIRSALKLVSSDTEMLNNRVQSILATRLTDKRYLRCHRYKRIAQFAYQDKDMVKECVKAIIKNIEKLVDRWLLAFDVDIVNRNPKLFARKSTERTVLFSLAYQGVIGLKTNKTPLFPALGNAFLLDNRPLAWYYIRYNALHNNTLDSLTINNEAVGNLEVVEQRYFESELFGLYDSGVNEENISNEHCKQIYSMFREYKEHILEHEKYFSQQIANANQQFGLTADQAIKTFGQSIALVENYIRNAKTVHPMPKLTNIPPKATSRREEVNAKNVVYLGTAAAG